MVDKSDNSIKVDTSIGSAQITGKVGRDVIVKSINNVTDENKKNLAEAAAEIQQLLDQLSQSYPTKTISQQGIVAAKAMEEIEKNYDTKYKIIKALKAGGTAAFVELTNNPVVKILTPMLTSLLEEEK